jgi:hypothetical protein
MTGPGENHLRPGIVTLGHVPVSRFVLGGNPFSGYSHQNLERSREMTDWYTMDRVKETYRQAERAGVTTHIGRGDHFIMRALREYWNEGGGLTWVCQTCPDVGSIERGVRNAVEGGAKCCFIHGGEMDCRVASGDTEPVHDGIKMIRDHGMPAGVAGHSTKTIRWAADNLDVDFFMASHYNPEDRSWCPIASGGEELYLEEDRDAMGALIQELPKPTIHYKVLAAGRNEPKAAFDYVAGVYRPGDVVCVGIFTKDAPDMIQRDVDLLETALRARGK